VRGLIPAVLADLISSDPQRGAGIAYVRFRLESSPDPIRDRAAYVSDDDIRQMAALLTGVGEAA
jgi:S-DNA-T family DNA segregation ATPase FtsK/SpoIIIE